MNERTAGVGLLLARRPAYMLQLSSAGGAPGAAGWQEGQSAAKDPPATAP